MIVPESIQKFIEIFSKLPSIGPRMATRLAFYLSSISKNDLKNLESALGGIKSLNRCKNCFFVTNGSALCEICRNPDREKNVIAIVEKETDLISLEKTGNFKGLYFILGSLPDRGTLETNQKLRLQYLKNRILKELQGKAKEIIVAFSPNVFGDFLYQIIFQEFKNVSLKISRLGRGIPTGGEIEFADEETLSQALERRI